MAAENVQQPPLARHDSKLLDLAFAMDTTGSMSSYIRSACNNVRKIVEDIVAKESSDVRLALVEYRDHPPQDNTYVTQVHDFTPRVAEMKRWLEASSAAGGGDTPEAVADALHQLLKLSWRPDATKICVLISDAPPHGLQPSGDGFPNGCPDGLDPMNIARQLAEKKITLYVAGCEPALVPYKDFFTALAYVTGGQYVPLQAASALTPVIVGGAQEEMSLEQWMEQVNQQVMAEVEARGAQNVNVDDLSRRVMGELNAKGARSRQLKVNKMEAAPMSEYVQSLSACVDMSEMRSKHNSSSARSCHIPPPPPAGAPDLYDAFHSSPAPPGAICSIVPPPPPTRSMGGAAPPPPPSFGTNSAMPQSAMAPDDYDVEEGSIYMQQAQRMVQKSLMRNNISIPKK